MKMFDIPDCDSCILLRPTMSLTLHIQQAMRSMRYMEGKEAVIIDQVENFKRHGLPDTPHEWTLDYKKKKENEIKTRTCDCCYSVYDIKKIICEKCDWDMRMARCKDCGEEQQYGRGTCVNSGCGGELIRGNPRNDREQVESEMSEIRAFTFKNWRDCKSIQELQQIQEKNGYKPGWVYYKSRELKLI